MSDTPADWLARIAGALDVPAPSSEEIDLLLDTTRVVAHATERKLGPLTTYLIGVHVAGGGSLTDAVRRIRELVPTANP